MFKIPLRYGKLNLVYHHVLQLRHGCAPLVHGASTDGQCFRRVAGQPCPRVGKVTLRALPRLP